MAMGNSVGSTASQQLVAATAGVSAGKSGTGASNLQQMLMPDPALGGSISAVDELVRYKVDELINAYDEERIVHERSR
jgi:hypothetical protein